MGGTDHNCDKADVIGQLRAGEDFMKEQLAKLEKGQLRTQTLLEEIGKTLVTMAHTQESVKRLFEAVEALAERVTTLEKRPGEKALKIQNMIETWIIRAFVAGGLVYFFADKI